MYFLPIISVAFLFSCSPTKYVSEDETLLEKNRFKISNRGIKSSQIEPYVRQKPNKRIFGARYHLGLYNMSNIDKENAFNKWLRAIGEEPVIFDPHAMYMSTEQIRSFVSSKGYFDAEVTDTVITTEKQRSTVVYSVDISTPYVIRNIAYEIADTNIRNLYVFDTANSVIVRGTPYDLDMLKQEMQRFERFVRDHGFYQFSSDYISFEVDSTIGNRQVDINFVVRSADAHSTFRINNIYIHTDFEPRTAIEQGDEYYRNLDTTFYQGYYFISSKDKPVVKHDFIIQSLYIAPGLIYNQTDTELSQSRLRASRAYHLVNINFNNTADSSAKTIDCVIQLTLLPQQSYKVELEGTHSGGYLGGGLNLTYQHKNLFRGAEQFTLNLKGAYELMRTERQGLEAIQEYGVESGLRLPNFLMPFFKGENFVRRYNLVTNIVASYNYQDMPYYTRTIANMSFGYNWRVGSYNEHFVNPLQFNIVSLERIDSVFYSQISASSYVAYAYQDVLILGGSYSYIFNNQLTNRTQDHWFVRWNFETAGNLLRAYNRISNSDKSDATTHQFINQPFAQYVKTDVDIRYNHIVNPAASMVYRGFLGVAVPYGNSKAIPFERQYFAGGANSIRGWQVRTLGPGSHSDTSATFLNQTADIKIELNAEYRFKLFWVLEGALFADAGNIWTYKSDLDRAGTQFKFNRFYEDLAVGTGLGLRFDFNFFLARLDFGMKLRDPIMPESNKWIFSNRSYVWRDFTAVIAIGYPF